MIFNLFNSNELDKHTSKVITKQTNTYGIVSETRCEDVCR